VTKRFFPVIVLLLLALTPAAPLRAIDLHDVLIDYTLTSWSRKDGLVGPVVAIAQGHDGFLWLGTDEGLVRFDGVRFVDWEAIGGSPLPRLSVRALHVGDDGALWAGFGGTGGVARIQARTAQIYSTIGNAQIGSVSAIVEDHDHVIWVAGALGLFRLAQGGWQHLGAAQGLPATGYTNAYVDSRGIVWVGTGEGFYRRPDATRDRFERVEDSNDSARSLSISEAPDGRVWANDPIFGFRPLDGRTTPQRLAQSGRGYRLLHDRDANLWVGTIGQGLWRVRDAGDPDRITIEKSTVPSGLSSDAVRCVFEDRDGNIWAGTTEGVDRLLPHRITPWTSLGLVSTVDATDDGHVWVGTEDGLIRFSRGAERDGWAPDGTRVPVRGARVLRSSGSDVVWVLADAGLFRVQEQTATRMALPEGVLPDNIEAIASDGNTGVWAIATGGILMRDDRTRLAVVNHLPLAGARAMAAVADHSGRLWLALSGSRVGVLSPSGQFQSYGTDDGVIGGTYYALHEDHLGALWVSGANGLSRFADGRFASVTRRNGLLGNGVYALTEDEQGYLWLGTSAGIFRLSRAEFDAAAGTLDRQMHFRVYDTSEGLAGFPVQLGDRNAVRAEDGTLWFITSRGVSVVDPRSLSSVRPAPVVTIDEVQANDLTVADGRLPAGTSKVQIEYTAPELTYPLKPRFRYRLEGFDTDWVEAGTRRQVLYANLPPQSYTFRVAVSDDEGRWSTSEATYGFSIAPRFYQARWFWLLCVLSAGGLVAGAWQLRSRQLRHQFAMVLGERVRLSRELHDTLLQSLVGLALEFDAVSKNIETSPAAARERVVKIRERVEEYIREARRSIWSLRSPALETADLMDALRTSGERATSGRPVGFAFAVHGAPRRQPANVEHQILRIAQEAVLNAIRHSGARQIHMDLQYDDRDITLRVTDDGRGFEPERIAEGTTDHYGITTMRERAQQIGGRVSISSVPGQGTVIEAVVPTTKENPAEAA
jgi:signal transduction histidine kinase/streptogramin lyase